MAGMAAMAAMEWVMAATEEETEETAAAVVTAEAMEETAVATAAMEMAGKGGLMP